MKQALTTALTLGVLAVALSSASAQMTMPDKWDQKCLDDAGKRYISCMANTGTNESAKQACQVKMNEEKKQCKKK